MPGVDVLPAGVIGPDTEDNLQQLFLDNNWTDKLPIVLPTRERVMEANPAGGPLLQLGERAEALGYDLSLIHI